MQGVLMMILTGNRGCGKTTLLKRIIMENNLAVQGFLSLKIVEDGVPVGIRILTLPEREEIFMATATRRKSGLSTGYYSFEKEAFQRLDERFALFDNNLPFILDEFGLLEMKGLGHYNLFKRLVSSRLKMLVVVRSDLLDEFVSRYAISKNMILIDVEKDNKDIKKLVHEYLSNKKGLSKPLSESYGI